MARHFGGVTLVLLTTALLAHDAGDIRVAGETLCATESLNLFYGRRNDALAWFDGDRLRQADARALLDAIESSSADGLMPSEYHLATLRRLIPDPTTKPRDLDVLLTDAFLLIASHMMAGRVDPQTIEPTWCLPPRSFDLPASLQAALDNHTIGETIARLGPPHAGYRRLRAELAGLRTIEARGGWASVERGARDQLATRLGIPLPPGEEQLNAAVRRFQRLHGLAVDGQVGPKTVRELNVPVRDRIRQVEINLERWRWLPSNLGERHGVINIPEFRLRLYEGGRESLSMKAVVGKDFQETPVFSSSITQVVLSPYWNVPSSIARKELWPKASRDRRYLAREHIEVLRGGRLRQTPGPWNSLGAIKFNLPNAYGVYLHDTPARELFSESVRAFSHGCIRIERPLDLATYLLRDNPAWPRERIASVSTARREVVVDVGAPLPIHVLYWTAFVGDDDELHFAPDVYHRDEDLDRAIRVTGTSEGTAGHGLLVTR